MESFKLSDAELVGLLKSGDESAFTVIYDRYWASLYQTALRILEDKELAKDVLQDAFISLFEKRSNQAINNVQAYLYQSVKYLCFMQLRSGKISDKHLRQINTIVITNQLEQDLNARELQSILDESIASLPEKCREVFCLSRYELLPNKKIAERLNISHKTVENQITKALKILHMSVDKLVILAVLLSL